MCARRSLPRATATGQQRCFERALSAIAPVAAKKSCAATNVEKGRRPASAQRPIGRDGPRRREAAGRGHEQPLGMSEGKLISTPLPSALKRATRPRAGSQFRRRRFVDPFERSPKACWVSVRFRPRYAPKMREGICLNNLVGASRRPSAPFHLTKGRGRRFCNTKPYVPMNQRLECFETQSTISAIPTTPPRSRELASSRCLRQSARFTLSDA